MNPVFSIVSALLLLTQQQPTNHKTATTESVQPTTKVIQTSKVVQPLKVVETSQEQPATEQVQRLSTKAPALNQRVLKLALNAYNKAATRGSVKNPILTVIDYSLPSSKQRMWVFDLRKERLLYNTHVAHGKNSGAAVPRNFSNTMSSKQTSLGTYITRDTYFGSKGLSLNLQGLEKGFNDNAYNRRVVVHGAWYVDPGYIKRAGQAGRSWGCPSVSKALAKPIIDTIKGGSVLFAYYPDKNYLTKSGYATTKV